jgi:hypothetical protein
LFVFIYLFTTDSLFDKCQYVQHLRLIYNLYKHEQLQMNLYLVHIQQQPVMLNDEYFFDHENNHHHDHDRQDRQEQYHHISIKDLRLPCNSIKDQDDHMHSDELGYDLKDKNKDFELMRYTRLVMSIFTIFERTRYVREQLRPRSSGP